MKYRDEARELAGRFKTIGNIVISMDEILVQALFALLTREHLLWIGKPGRAKSFTARIIFRMLEGAHAFKTQVTQDMLPSSLFGSPIPDEYMKTGKEIICIDGGLAQCDVCLLEEFFDGNRALIRSVLTALNERFYESKDQVVTVPLHTAVLTTNWKKEDEASAAVRDRIVFKANFPDLSGLTDHLMMYESYLGYAGEIPKVEPFPFETVRQMAQLVESPDGIPIPMEIRLVYAMLIKRFKDLRIERAKQEFLEQANQGLPADPNQPQARIIDVREEELEVRDITPRTQNKLLDIIRAQALLHGHESADYDDLEAVRYGLLIINDPSGDREDWDKAFAEVVPRSSAAKKALSHLGSIAEKVIELKKNPPENLKEIVVDMGGKATTYTKASLIEFLDKIGGSSVVTEIAKQIKDDISHLGEKGDKGIFDALVK